MPLRTLLPPPPDSASTAWSPRAVESIPPASDAPVATSVRVSTSGGSKRRRGSGWPIVMAAAVGLLVGLASIVTSTSVRRSAAAEAPEGLPVAQELPSLSPRLATVATADPQPASSVEVEAEMPPATSARRTPVATPAKKKSIF